jgi:hypothetical protein
VIRRGKPCPVLFIVSQGTIQLSTENKRGYSIVIHRSRGEFVGEEFLFGRERSPYQAVAVVSSELYALNPLDLAEAAARSPAILTKLLERLARIIQSARSQTKVQKEDSDRLLLSEGWLANRITKVMASTATGRVCSTLFLLAMCGWGILGQIGMPRWRVSAFDVSPFSKMTMGLKVVAVFSAPLFLRLLVGLETMPQSMPRSRVKLLKEFKRIEVILASFEKRTREQSG